jgi:hypothetical protein
MAIASVAALFRCSHSTVVNLAVALKEILRVAMWIPQYANQTAREIVF